MKMGMKMNLGNNENNKTKISINFLISRVVEFVGNFLN